jgi:hypothetical protein
VKRSGKQDRHSLVESCGAFVSNGERHSMKRPHAKIEIVHLEIAGRRTAQSAPV